MNAPAPNSPLVVADTAAWREWLQRNDDHSDGIWLTLAKKGVASPTSLTYQDALEEALCSGWIDGQRRGRDASTFNAVVVCRSGTHQRGAGQDHHLGRRHVSDRRSTRSA